MAKFALYTTPFRIANQEFEGDELIQDKDYARILKNPRNDNEVQRVVASIHLAPGQYIKQIAD